MATEKGKAADMKVKLQIQLIHASCSLLLIMDMIALKIIMIAGYDFTCSSR